MKFSELPDTLGTRAIQVPDIFEFSNIHEQFFSLQIALL